MLAEPWLIKAPPLRAKGPTGFDFQASAVLGPIFDSAWVSPKAKLVFCKASTQLP